MAEALQKVKNLNMDQVVEVGLLIDYLIPTANVDVKTYSPGVILAELCRQCEKNPDIMLDCFKPSAKEDIFILNLCKEGIIRKNADGFHDGGRYIGSSLESVRDYKNKKENNAAIERWSVELLRKQGKVSTEKSLYDRIDFFTY